MFEEWGFVGNALVLIASLVILDRASELTIDSVVKVANISGFGKTTIGFILVAFATTLPELSVSVFAATGGKGMDIAIGNVLGSNIVNICLILGVGFLIASFKNGEYLKMLPTITKEEVGSLYFGLFIASAIPLTLVYIRYASRFMGAVLIAIFIFNIYRISKQGRLKNEGSIAKKSLKLYVLLTFLGTLIVVASAYFIVNAAINIATWIGIPQVIIGSTIVAFGTSLPEFANGVKSAFKGYLDLALGNIVGSCFTNITLILGVAFLASPFAFDIKASAAFINLVVFSLITNLLLWYFLSSERIGWREGLILLFIYAVFIATSFGGFQQ